MNKRYRDRLKEIASDLDCLEITTNLIEGPDGQFLEWSGCRFPDNHHYGSDGLGEHVLEVVETCLMIASFYEDQGYKINKQILFLSALFHDVGKLYDYAFDGAQWTGTDHKNKIHHICRSAFVWRDMNNFKDYGYHVGFIDDVVHCILSHHDRPEWGSPIRPQTLEAVILHSCDTMSALVNRIGKHERS